MLMTTIIFFALHIIWEGFDLGEVHRLRAGGTGIFLKKWRDKDPAMSKIRPCWHRADGYLSKSVGVMQLAWVLF
jgi:hypothetical protein